MGAFDDIIAKYGNAQARFSRAPISFVDIGGMMRALKDLGATFEGDPYPRGEYSPETKKIRVVLPPGSTPDDAQDVVRHEDVHALLDATGRLSAPLISQYGYTNIPERGIWGFFQKLGVEPGTNLVSQFVRSGRSGNFNEEAPAYMAAYVPGEIKDITPQMAGDWLAKYAESLPKETADRVLRIGEISRGAQPIVGRSGVK